jgi:transcriptional pleiotropic regulator of transition state genes
MNIIDNETLIEVYVDGETIILKKYTPKCIFCGQTKDICIVKGKVVCSSCLLGIKK